MDAERINANIESRKKAEEMVQFIVDEGVHLAVRYDDECRMRFLKDVRNTVNSMLPEGSRLVEDRPVMLMEDGEKNQRSGLWKAVKAEMTEGVVLELRDKAVKIRTNGDVIWVPLSQIESKVPDAGCAIDYIVIPEWLASEKGLDYEEY